MTDPWTPEVELAPDQVADLVGPLLGAPPRDVRPVGEGWDNAAFLIDGTWLFRFPRRAVAVPLLEREVRVLPRLAPRLPAPIPVPVHVGSPAGGYPWPFAGYRALAGREAALAGLDDARRAALAAPVADLLRALHALPPDALGEPLPVDPMGRADMRTRVPKTLQAVEDLVSLGLLDDARPWREVVEPARDLPPRAPSAIVHGDLHARHLLVDDAGGLAGVIDWGDVHLGNPGVDLQLLWSYFPAAARGAFLARYGPVSPERLLIARVVAVFLSAALAAYAEKTGRRALRDEALAGLRRCLDATS